MIHELGYQLARSSRFDHAPELIYADIDVARIRQQRMRFGTFNDAARALSLNVPKRMRCWRMRATSMSA